MGAVNPSGRLPLTLPLLESDMLAPCTRMVCPYTEGVHVGWRALQGKPVAFPFGHGLSFTTFEYAWASAPAWAEGTAEGGSASASMQITVRNSGAVAGAEVVQVYVRFPAAAAQPDLVLRAFAKTAELGVGEVATLCFGLGSRDLSVWDEGKADAHGSKYKGGWRLVRGEFGIVVGASSRDVRLETTLVVPAGEV